MFGIFAEILRSMLEHLLENSENRTREERVPVATLGHFRERMDRYHVQEVKIFTSRFRNRRAKKKKVQYPGRRSCRLTHSL